MTVLPKYLYLFQCLPVFIPGTFFKKIDSIISSYIWNGKQPRLRKEFLQRAKHDGGMALPNFRFYYWAANLYCMSHWTYYHLHQESPTWVKLETHSCGSASLAALMGAALSPSVNITNTNPVVSHSLKIYFQFRKHFNLQGISLFSPVASNHCFPPSTLDTAFNMWHRRGLKCLNDLFIDNIFASFTELSKKFILPSSHIFRYFQIRDYVKTVLPQFPNKPSKSIIDDIMSFNPTRKRAISHILGLLSGLECTSMSRIRIAWEQDLRTSIDDGTWAKIVKRVHSSSMCAQHSLVQFKLIHRVHFSKAKLAKIYPQINPICDRCKLGDVTLIHMFWLCPKLKGHWKAIFEALSTVLTVKIDPNPLMSLFGIIPEGMELPVGGHKIVAFTTLLARRLILLRWKEAVPPSVSHWIRDVLSNLKLEKIRYTLRGSEDKFFKVWRPFLIFFDKSTIQVQE